MAIYSNFCVDGVFFCYYAIKPVDYFLWSFVLNCFFFKLSFVHAAIYFEIYQTRVTFSPRFYCFYVSERRLKCSMILIFIYISTILYEAERFLNSNLTETLHKTWDWQKTKPYQVSAQYSDFFGHFLHF